jgi:hypothetical protein
MCQKFIYKIHSARLRDNKWKLTLPIYEARKNDEIIALADSSTLRFIDKLNNITDSEFKCKQIKKELSVIKNQPKSKSNRDKIRKLYSDLDAIQFKPDYMCLIIDKNSDYNRAKKGFYINGIRYHRYVGTPNGVKNETIVFVSDRHYSELSKHIENGRNPNVELVPAKFEAYKALDCSASILVSNPKGVLVVDDCITHFKSDTIHIDDTNDGEPQLFTVKDDDVELSDSDGYGLILPSLSLQWNKDIGEKEPYISSGYCVRNSFCKGMVFCFDFIRFAYEVAGTDIVCDAWENWHNINDIEIILTTSMLKLWDSYDSIEDYLSKCEKNGHGFSITKCCPKELENERNLNYQFIQSYNFTDQQIQGLIQPTIDEIKDVLGGDYYKSLLFLKGIYLNDDNVNALDCDFAKALMIDKRMINDPFVRTRIYQMIKKRITEAKVGVIKVHSNFSIVSGDPYSLCQHIFELEVTGLLKSGQAYSKYWLDKEVDKVACFRAPMTCHNNIRILNITATDEMIDWYQYMTTCTIFNSWDTVAHALNGLDKDSDQILTTDNKYIIENVRNLPAIMCIQRRAKKKIVTEDDLVKANINSFGDEIGSTTNRITSMIEVQSQFSADSEEYKVLDYRIRCGQLFQQNAIDKTKGIIAKPMPKEWFNRDSNKIRPEDNEETIKLKKFNQSIVADKKPYFMCYIYPQDMTKYKKYIANTNRKALREFRITMQELFDKPNKTKREKEFINYYYQRMPVGISKCVVNRICWIFEKEFDGYLSKELANVDFDYNILKHNVGYNQKTFNDIKNIYDLYINKLQDYRQLVKREHIDSDEATVARDVLKQDFKKECEKICSKQYELCDIVLDICYQDNRSKQFAWDVCGDVIIEKLLKENNNTIMYPELDENGTIEYGGNWFTMRSKQIGGDLD